MQHHREVLVTCERDNPKDAQHRLSNRRLVKAWGQLLRRPPAEVVDPVVGVRRAPQLTDPLPQQRGWRGDIDGSNPVLIRVGGGEIGGRRRMTFAGVCTPGCERFEGNDAPIVPHRLVRRPTVIE
jgi:hypothetical protein